MTTTPDTSSAGHTTGPIPVQRSAPDPAGTPGLGASPLPPQPPIVRRLSPALAFVLGTALGAVLVGGIWAGTSLVSANASFTMTGSMMLNDGVTTAPSPGCHGYRGYSDIDQGASVTVYDAKGTVIATGALGQGTVVSGGAGCLFPVRVENVPDGSAFYQVEVSHRGKITVQSADARAGRLGMSLGS